MAEFKEKESLPFILATDEDHKIAQAYEVWVEKSMYGRKYWGNERTTYIIDPEGNIARIFPKVKPAAHSGLVLDALAELTG